MVREFNEKDHPRHPAKTAGSKGGEFRRKGSVSAPSVPKTAAKRAAPKKTAKKAAPKDSEFTKRQKARTAAKKATPPKKAAPAKAPAKKATPPKKAPAKKAPTKKAAPRKDGAAGAFAPRLVPGLGRAGKLEGLAARRMKTARGKLREGTDALSDDELELLYEYGDDEEKARAAIGAGTRALGRLLTPEEINRVRANIGRTMPWLDKSKRDWASQVSDTIKTQRLEMYPPGSGKGPLRGAGISIVNDNDEDVTDPTEARAAVSDALGYPYEGPLEPGAFEGSWIIDLPERQADDLIDTGFWGVENPDWTVEAEEWDEGKMGGDPRSSYGSPEAWAGRVEELLADEGLAGEIDFNDMAEFPDPDAYVQYLIDNGMTQRLEDLY